jgi:CubicO group peptidase (beta-lactamase class C family)
MDGWHSRWWTILVVWLAIVGGLRAADEWQWRSGDPADHGLDRETLEEARRALADRGTRNFLVVRDGRIVYEWYSPDSGPNKRHYTASLAKALVGGMSFLLALNDGLVRVDDPAWKYIPAWKGDPRKSLITLRHLATHSSGIEDAEEGRITHMELPGWKGVFWRKDPDPFTPAIYQAPVIFPPGTAYAYSNPGMGALAYAVTASLPRQGPGDLRSLLRERVMEPIGVGPEEWSIGYDETYRLDGLSLVPDWGGGSFTARAVARVGLLMLQRGNWDGRQLVDPSWVDRVTEYAGTPIPERPVGNRQPASGLGWWTNQDSAWSRVPSDAFAGAGAGQQVLLVVPSLGLVVVRNGDLITEEGLGFWGGIEKYLFNPVMSAVQGYTPGAVLAEAAPYPSSPVIGRIRFADRSSIVRRAEGSDNWPLTWADDDNLYSAYGDGWGFEPRLPNENKLSLGLVKILGAPDDFQGLNIRSKTGEQIGQGPAGKKASSLLCVNGRLYMWARNAENSQLAWSDDHGLSWSWSPWRFSRGFGYPAFLNFGRDYRGSRDRFVYVYSPDSASAYEAANRMNLARVPEREILSRDSYEFFTGFRDGEPRWSRDIDDRGAVFSNPGNCYRSSVSYNPALRRYLLVQILPGDAPRFFGGIAIYDAPEPWGPWTTAFFTRYFDVGPGESAHLPTKWMSPDGRTMYLVFSGDDQFSVRRLEVTAGSSGARP